MRLQINTTKEVVDEIDRRAAAIGISRNAMCAVLLHDAVMGGNTASCGDARPGAENGLEVRTDGKETEE